MPAVFLTYPFYSTLSIRALSIATCFCLTMWVLPLFSFVSCFLKICFELCCCSKTAHLQRSFEKPAHWEVIQGRRQVHDTLILAQQWDKSRSMNNRFFASSRWEDTVELTAHLPNKIILYSHLKPLVHSFCSPRSMQFALLWLAIGNMLVFNYLHISIQ